MAESNAEQIQAEWWAGWRRADYTWPGLANKQWPGWIVTDEGSLVEAETGRVFGDPRQRSVSGLKGRPASLQDYWRVDPQSGQVRTDAEMEGELILHPSHFRPSDRSRRETYHPVHLPLTYADGTPTVKEGWASDRLDSFVQPRLEIACKLRQGVGELAAAWFEGGIWLRAPDPPAGHVAPVLVLYGHAGFVGKDIVWNWTFDDFSSFLGAAFHVCAHFRSSVFGRYINFDRVKFLGGTNFDGTVFGDGASFLSSHFEYASFFGCEFQGYGMFNDAIFAKDVEFRGTCFEKVGFARTRFEREAGFHDVRFRHEADFRDAEFMGPARFVGASFLGPTSFNGACFLRMASFENVHWPSGEINRRGAFNHVLFGGIVSLGHSGCHAFTVFDGARIERGLALGDGPERAAETQLRCELQAIEGSEAGLNALESGCRVLKQAMALQSDKAREQMFYRFELIARRKQKATPLTERLFSWLYGATSNYGASIGRPIVSLVALVVAFAGVYWGLQGAFTSASAIDALGFSASRIFPFGAFEDVSKEWIGGFERHDSLATLGIRVLASFESLFALVLVFLLGLAVRRKFQIG